MGFLSKAKEGSCVNEKHDPTIHSYLYGVLSGCLCIARNGNGT